MAGGWGLQLERDRGSAMADWPVHDGPGNRCAAPPPPRRMPLDNQSMLREDGHAKWRAAARSLALWRTCQNADVERDGDATTDRPREAEYGKPQARLWRGRTIGRHLSGLSCFLQRQTEAVAFALQGRCIGVTRVISAWRQRHLPLLSHTT